MLTHTHTYIYISKLFKESTITFIIFMGMRKMMARLGGRQGCKATMGRRREYAASVEKEAEIPARILEQKCSNI
jgi:hypothetical protein